jgi:hypothetical protein
MRLLLIVFFITALAGCDIDELDASEKAYSSLNKVWQAKKDDGSLSNYWYYFSANGDRRIFGYNEEWMCYDEQKGLNNTFPYTDFVNNQLKPYRIRSGSKAYLANGLYVVSDDGKLLARSGGLSGTSYYVQADLSIDDIEAYICLYDN